MIVDSLLTITNYHSHGQTAKEVRDSSQAAVARPNGRAEPHIRLFNIISGHDERLMIRFLFCGVSSNSCELTLSSEDILSL